MTPAQDRIKTEGVSVAAVRELFREGYRAGQGRLSIAQHGPDVVHHFALGWVMQAIESAGLEVDREWVAKVARGDL